MDNPYTNPFRKEEFEDMRIAWDEGYSAAKPGKLALLEIIEAGNMNRWSGTMLADAILSEFWPEKESNG